MSNQKKNSVKKDFEFSLVNVKTASFTLNEPSASRKVQDTARYNITVNQVYRTPQEEIVNKVSVSITNIEDNKDLFARIEVYFIFHVVDMQNHIYKEKGKDNFPQEYLDIINSISISTIRGMILTMFRGSHLTNPILPIFDVRNLKKEN